jgi:hypothetical protein
MDVIFESVINRLKLKIGMRAVEKPSYFDYQLTLNVVKPVFVISTGRSGTKYVATSYRFKPNVVATHKGSPEMKIAHTRLKNMSLQCRMKILDAVRSEQIFSAHTANLTYLETNHHLTSFSDAIPTLYPNSKFIHITRSFSDYLSSSIKRGSFQNSWIDRGKHYCADNISGTTEEKAFHDFETTQNCIKKIKDLVKDEHFVELKLSDLDKDWRAVCLQLDFPYVRLNGSRNR